MDPKNIDRELFGSSEEWERFSNEDEDGQIRILKKQRCRMMCEMHEQQQEIDEIDYLIRVIKSKQEE